MVNGQIKNELINLIETLPENDIITAKIFIEFLVAKKWEVLKKPSKSKRKAAAKKLYGICANLPGGSEEFMREKHEDNEREEQQFRERCR